MSIQIGFEDGEKDLDWIGLTEALNTKPSLAWACAREVESPS